VITITDTIAIITIAILTITIITIAIITIAIITLAIITISHRPNPHIYTHNRWEVGSRFCWKI
jgi:hypothetical protein